MKKVILSVAVLLSFGLYSVHEQHEATEAKMAVGKITLPTATIAPSATPTAKPEQTSDDESDDSSTPITAVPTSTPAPTTPVSSGKYKDGEYTGDSTDAFYGNIQVKAIINGGKLTDVQFLQYPNDRETSIQINQQAMPMLRSEAIQAQSSNVDIVSGATDSSRAFQVSLSSALSKAQ